MGPRLRIFVGGHPGWKARYHYGLWNRYFFSNLDTRLALPWTQLFLLLRLKPNAISALSFLVSIAGMGFIGFGAAAWAPAVGGLLLMIGLLWDHCDGQVARIRGNGTLGGGLFDTILDRWIEFGWVAAFGIRMLRFDDGFSWIQTPVWVLFLVVAWAAQSTIYVRWSNVQNDLYLVQKELRLVGTMDHEARTIQLKSKMADNIGRLPDTKFLYLPFAFNRDVSLWMLFVASLVPDYMTGVAVFAAVHTLNGLEKNWYTLQNLRRKEPPTTLSSMMNPDYHK